MDGDGKPLYERARWGEVVTGASSCRSVINAVIRRAYSAVEGASAILTTFAANTESHWDAQVAADGLKYRTAASRRANATSRSILGGAAGGNSAAAATTASSMGGS